MLINNLKKKYCFNCGKYGHYSKTCKESITSLGVICVKFTNLPINDEMFKKFINSRYLDIDTFNLSHLDNISKLDYFKNNIQFLMIRRKHSLSYIEFIRGKYNINNVDNLFKKMSPDEIILISKNNFDYLWSELWKKTANDKIFQKEYTYSKNQFEKLILLNKLEYLVKIKPIYDSPEWGFPKGKRNLFENNINCAIRELKEETNVIINSNDILNKINYICEEYTGSNNINYKHIYYLNYMDNNKCDENILNYSYDINHEVSSIKWFNLDDAIKHIRTYYDEKIKVVNMVYFLFLNLYLEYNT